MRSVLCLLFTSISVMAIQSEFSFVADKIVIDNFL